MTFETHLHLTTTPSTHGRDETISRLRRGLPKGDLTPPNLRLYDDIVILLYSYLIILLYYYAIILSKYYYLIIPWGDQWVSLVWLGGCEIAFRQAPP